MLKNLKTKIVAILFIIIIFISVISSQLIVFAKENINNTQEKSPVYENNYKQSNSTNSNIVSLYCWDIDDFNLSKLKDEVEYLKINTLYIQRPANDKQSDRLKQIIEFAKQYNLDIFLLEGARDWLTTGDINNVTNLIDEAYEINKTLDYKFKGVSLDVEFYLTDDYQSSDTDIQIELFKMFTENTKKCCDYANSLGLEYSMALPVWLNKLSQNILEDLMNYNYDHIAFMNYFKETIMDNIDEEVEIAKNHNIKIVSIAEVQDPKYGTVGEEDTFYNDGLQECINTLNNIQQKYNYKNLGISYHYYKPLLSLLERDTNVGIENKYEVEVYPYIDGKNVKIDEATIKVDNDTIEPIHGFYNETGKYFVSFYGLEYGKEYKLTVKSGDYIGTKIFTYQKGDNAFDNLEITQISITLEENKQIETDPNATKPEENKPNNQETEENKQNGQESENKKPDNQESEQNQPNKQESENNKPNGQKTGNTNLEGNELNEQQLEKNKQNEKEYKEIKTEKIKNNKDITMTQSVLPKTGKVDIIEKLLIISIILMVSIAVINKINDTKNKS